MEMNHRKDCRGLKGYRLVDNDAWKHGFHDYQCIECGAITSLDCVEEEEVFREVPFTKTEERYYRKLEK